jgi:uncharacterized protein
MSARRALVTGATDGLGLHLSRLLATGGWAVTLVARSTHKLEEAAGSLDGTGHDVIEADLCNREAVTALVEHVEAGGIDLLVNNAGGTRFGAFASLSDAEVSGFLDLNLLAPARLSRAFMAAATPGSVLVNVTSVAGTVPMPGNAVYSAAKAGSQVLAECLWWESRGGPVRVMEYRPASIRTRFHESAGGASLSGRGLSVTPEAAARDILERIGQGREFVQSPGAGGWIFELLRRVLPKRVVLELLGRKARKAGYLS